MAKVWRLLGSYPRGDICVHQLRGFVPDIKDRYP
jgi:hypothetical protein